MAARTSKPKGGLTKWFKEEWVDLKTGKAITQYEIGASISSTCAVSNGWIFVGCEDGSLYAFSTGNPK